MPQVQMRCDPARVDGVLKTVLPLLLAGFVAEALHVEEVELAHLAATDVEVVVTDVGPYDVNVVPLSIMVVAHDFPQRSENATDRAQKIALKVRGILDQMNRHEITGSVWIPLSKGYVTF